MSDETVLCRNCKYIKKKFLFGYKDAVCKHPKANNTYIDKVSGKREGYLASCDGMRKNNFGCGANGVLYEPKDKVEAVVQKLERGV